MIQHFYRRDFARAFLALTILGAFSTWEDSHAGNGVQDGNSSIRPGTEYFKRIESGEVIVEERTASEAGASVVAWILIHAPVERIWETIISCEQAAHFVAGLRHCEVLEETGDHALVHQVVDKGWSTPKLDYTFATRRKPFVKMEVELASGNLRSLRGDWIFETMNGDVLLQHRLELRPTVPVPRWLVRRNLKKDLPAMLTCIRGLVSGSGTEEASARERAQCPGSVE